MALVDRAMLMKLNGPRPEDIDAHDRQFINQARAEEPVTTNLYMRTYKMDASVFTTTLQKATGSQTTNISAMAESFFRTFGLEFKSPGKSVFYNNRLGVLFVRATLQDLDAIESVIRVLNSPPPQNPAAATNSSEANKDSGQLVQASSSIPAQAAKQSSRNSRIGSGWIA